MSDTRSATPQPVALPIEGRWDMVVQTPQGPKPSWLEVRHSGAKALVGQFVGIAGSARPISHIAYDAGAFQFSIPPQWERVTGDLTVEGRVEGEGMAGSLVQPDGSRLSWSATRAQAASLGNPQVGDV